MERLAPMVRFALLTVVLAMACEKRAATPTTHASAVPSTPAVVPASEDVGEPREVHSSEEPAEASSQACAKLLTCCDAWVKTTPTAQVGCDAQRAAFQAAETPEKRAALEGLCVQALEVWAKLPNIPEICK